MLLGRMLSNDVCKDCLATPANFLNAAQQLMAMNFLLSCRLHPRRQRSQIFNVMFDSIERGLRFKEADPESRDVAILRSAALTGTISVFYGHNKQWVALD